MVKAQDIVIGRTYWLCELRSAPIEVYFTNIAEGVIVAYCNESGEANYTTEECVYETKQEAFNFAVDAVRYSMDMVVAKYTYCINRIKELEAERDL